jgi:PhzF family phenazine biosynthesis protein
MNTIPMYQVDAFTNTPFKGNPAAICLPETALSAELMQSIAAENNLAETAFVTREEDGFRLRWFTPTVEIDLCGHATLASAHILWQEGILSPGEVARFHTRSGLLTATQKEDWIELNFPVSPFDAKELPAEMKKALGVNPVSVAFGKERYLVELATAEEVASLQPDFGILKHYDAVVVTSLAGDHSPYDFVSRSFVPSHGVDEDPVTGSSHCLLVPYYAAKLKKFDFHAFQVSARGGELLLQLTGDRVLIAGQAVTVIKGVFFYG